MNINDYLDKYQNIPFKKSAFNEIDALIFASLAYPQYDKFIGRKKAVKGTSINSFLKDYDIRDLTNRRKQYIELLKRISVISRYKGLVISNYKHHNDPDSTKQFQAVTFIIKDLMIVSFCGTDGTMVGLKEDINMSYLDITPSDIEAIEYLRFLTKAYPYKKLILVGHSKGGRLALAAAKGLMNKNRIVRIYTFDAPNFQKDFYDDEYQKMLTRVNRYTPDESIIGRLISEPINCRIVKSNNSLIMQHDTSSWEIEGDHFKYEKEYSKRSTRIVNSLNSTFSKYSNEVKKEFTDTLFDLLDRLDIKELTTKEKNLLLIKKAIKKLPFELKKCSKEERTVLKTVLLGTLIDFIKD